MQFDLRLILFWIMPWVAVTAATLAWRGPYASEFLNQHARWTLTVVEAGLWACLYLSARLR